MKLSIVIPVYNVEPYLESCLQSVLEQELDDYEVILVDDCSSDNSGNICDDWANRHGCFKVVHCEKNAGLSMARNVGIQIARGDYITFVDSDDFIAPKTLKWNMTLLERNLDVDILEYPVYVYYGAKDAYKYIPQSEKKVNYIEWITDGGYTHAYAWNKIYRKNIWQQFSFPIGKLIEDLFTIPYVIKASRKLIYSDKGIYYYCKRKGSISNTLNRKSAEDYLNAIMKLYNDLCMDSKVEESVADDLYMCLCNAQITLLRLGGDVIIPNRNISIHKLCSRHSLKFTIKVLLNFLFGRRFCYIIASFRKNLK